MVIEMFDKCSELDEYYKKNYTYRNMSASEATLNSCDKLTVLSNEHDNTLRLMREAQENADADAAAANVVTSSTPENLNQNVINFGGLDSIINNDGIRLVFKNIPGLPIYLLLVFAVITTIFIAIPLVPVIMTGSVLFVISAIMLIILTMFGIFVAFR
jgi:hypothetical protein